MKYMATIDADEKPVCCEFVGCNGNVTPYLIGSTTDIKTLEQEPRKGHWILTVEDWNKWECSECGYTKRTDIHVGLGYNYCPNCGAKMVETQESEK